MDVPTRFVAPTVVRDVALDDVLMAECVFKFVARVGVRFTSSDAGRSSGRYSRSCPLRTSTRPSQSSGQGVYSQLHACVMPCSRSHREHPLAVYVFSQDKAFQDKGTNSMAASVNPT